MDLLDAPTTKRIITRVYGRKRERGVGEQNSEIRLSRGNESTMNSGGQPKQNAISKEEKVVEQQTAIPSTPPRKRYASSRDPSVSRSSSSSPSKVNIDRDIARIFSPKGKLSPSKRFTKEEGEEEERETLQSNPSSYKSSPRSAKPSFADRMAPRKQKERSSATHLQRDRNKLSEAAITNVYPIKSRKESEERGGSQESAVSATVQANLLEAPQRPTYGRAQSLASQRATTSLVKCTTIDDQARPSIKNLKKRWAELDDLDESDDEVQATKATKTKTKLWINARHQQFVSDYQYYLLDVRTTQSIEVRRSSSVALAEVALALNDRDEGEFDEEGDMMNSEEDETNQGQMGTVKTPLLSPFIKELKMADLTGQLWFQLRRIGAGDGKDEILDTVLALLLLNIASCDSEMSLTLCSEAGFGHTLALMMRSEYLVDTVRSRDVRRHMGTLTIIARASALLPCDEELKVGTLVLNIVSKLTDASDDQTKTVGHIGIAKVEQGISIAGEMWKLIASEAKSARTLLHQSKGQSDDANSTSSTLCTPNLQNLELLARIFTNCATQAINNPKLHCQTSASDLITLLHYIIKEPSTGEKQMAEEEQCLGSLLRMVIALVACESPYWGEFFFKAEGIVSYLVQLIVKVSGGLELEARTNDEQRCDMDLVNLSLALLTDFLIMDSDVVRREVLCMRIPCESARRERKDGIRPIEHLGYLLHQQREKADADPDANYLVGSLTVVSGLLVVGAEAKEEGEEKERDAVLEQLKIGMKCTSAQDCIKTMVASLDEFAAMIQLVSTSCNSIRTLSAKADEAKKDEAIFHRLSKELTLILESFSSSTNNS